jgi:hypothetical protein
MSGGLDQIFTPEPIIRDMIRSARSRNPRVIADFAAGDGGILALASRRWRDARIFANDVDCKVVRSIRLRHPSWSVSCSDVLNPRSAVCTKYAPVTGLCSLIFLNPPFSCRGAATKAVEFFGERVQCGRALSFVIWSLRMLAKDGELVAVLPLSTLTAAKDRVAWQAIRSLFDVELLGRYDRGAFQGCVPRSILVRLQRARQMRRRSKKSIAQILPLHGNAMASLFVTVVRGWIPLYSVRARTGAWRRLIHTTEMRDGVLKEEGVKAVRSASVISGPAVLIPRVGKPDRSKICVVRAGDQYALSDCVIALLTSDERDASRLYDLLLRIWPRLQNEYEGTCAPYVTLDALRRVLEDAGGVRSEYATPRSAIRPASSLSPVGAAC